MAFGYEHTPDQAHYCSVSLSCTQRPPMRPATLQTAGYLLWALGLLVGLCLGLSGCHNIFAQKAAELEADRTLSELTRLKPVPEPNIALPDYFRAPPKIIQQNFGGAPEWKLIYFCRYHTAEELKTTIDRQFANKTFPKKGNPIITPIYPVSVNPACNQLIIRCPTEQEAQAVLEVLKHVDIPTVQVRIDCIVSEVYADLTMDRETTIKIQNLLGEHINLGGKETTAGELLPAFPGAALRDVARSKFGLKVGYLKGKEAHIFEALVDILESRGYLKILMNPSLEVVNGQHAEIQAREHVPVQTISLTRANQTLSTRTQYTWVIDRLSITPHVFADSSIGLEISAALGARAVPEGVKQIPIVTKREITIGENRIRTGESLVIGGIRKTERRAVVRGVPFLKDIPLLNLLFSSKDFEERAIETLFIITPTISTGGIPATEMIEELRKSKLNAKRPWPEAPSAPPTRKPNVPKPRPPGPWSNCEESGSKPSNSRPRLRNSKPTPKPSSRPPSRPKPPLRRPPPTPPP